MLSGLNRLMILMDLNYDDLGIDARGQERMHTNMECEEIDGTPIRIGEDGARFY